MLEALLLGEQCCLCALQDPTTSKPYYKRIAEHFEQAGNLEEAERHFIKAEMAHQVSLQVFNRPLRHVVQLCLGNLGHAAACLVAGITAQL